MLNKKLFIIFLILSGLLGFSFSARATIISQIYFTDFVIEKAHFTAGEEIKGNFTLWNYEKEVVPDITYSYKLLAQDSSGFYTIVLDEKFSGDNFSLKPDQKVTKSLSYYLPHNLPSGAAVLLAAGNKGKRFSLPNGQILLHQVAVSGVSGEAVEVEIAAKQILKLKEKVNKILARHTGQPLERIEKDTDRDFYLSASESQRIRPDRRGH